MKTFGLTDRGTVRANNQDCFIIEKCNSVSCYVFALCDGMGGEKAGDLASRLAVKAFVEHVYEKLAAGVRKYQNIQELLKDACEEANGVAWEYSRFDEAYNGMGTTIVGGVAYSDGRCCLINVGDSRAYKIQHHGREMIQITRDHSLVEDLVEAGIITREEAKTHPQRNVITRALGSEGKVDADYFETELHPGEWLLLCSDGLYTTLTSEQIQQEFHGHPDPETVCNALMTNCLSAGARDNVTILAVRR